MPHTSTSNITIDPGSVVPNWAQHSTLTRAMALHEWLVRTDPASPLTEAAGDLVTALQADFTARFGISRALDHVREGWFIARYGRGLVQR